MKFPAVFLSFDDIYIDEWHEKFIDSPIKATFNPTHLETITPEGWAKLRALQAAGHAIGCHGLRHLRPGAGIGTTDGYGFLSSEIYPALDLYEKNGLRRPTHYVCPNGNHTDDSDRVLLNVFKTVRIGGSQVYSERDLQTVRVLKAANWRHQHSNLIQEAIGRNGAALVYLHLPMADRLAALYRFSPAVNFYTLDEL